LLALLVLLGAFCPPRSGPRRPASAPSLSVGCENAATPDAQSVGTETPVRSQLLEHLGVPAWHHRGWRGQGLKVAVLDSGFSGYSAHLGKALPQSVKVRSFRFDGNFEAKDSQHGILCAEVIHALAPDAELLLANWEPEHPDQFLAAVRWARQEGARILSCSIIMPTWSDGEGHGRIHEELARLLGPADSAASLLFFASAGNTAQRHWGGPFQDGGDGFHNWKPTGAVVQTENPIRPWGADRVSVELCCPIDSGYEVIVSDATSGRLVGRMRSIDGGGTGNAVVNFTPELAHDYRVRVRRVLKSSGGFHLVVLGGGLSCSTNPASIPFPGDGPEVIAVGAVDATGHRLVYSSCGSAIGATKPDFVAIVPFPSTWRARPFSGTSAAAPQAAGLAALVCACHPDWGPRRVQAALKEAARPCSSGCPSWEIGNGRIHLPLPDAPDPERAALLP
jgi:subtilisin family serine protease